MTPREKLRAGTLTTLGTIAVSPVLFLYCCKVAKNKLAGWDAAFLSWAHCPEQRKAWRLFSRLGDGWLYAGFYLLARIDGYNTKPMAVSIFLAWGISAALKLTIRRKRGKLGGHWVIPERPSPQTLASRLYAWSFPSQHAACAVAFACALWPNPTGVAFALAVCASRVLIGAHYLSDVLAGVAVGLLAWRLA